MKTFKTTLLSLCALLPAFLCAQPRILADAWSDPEFVDRFTGSFLPLSETEPKISEAEAELFQELSELLANNQTQAAIARLAEEIRTAAEPDEVSAALHYTLANLYLQNSQFAEAVRQYRTAIEKFPNFQRAYKNLGLARIQSREFTEAIEALVKAVELGDSGGDTFGLLAYAYLNEGNPTAALEGYRQASLLNPGNREWRIGKAEALMRTERYEEAIAIFKQLIKETPERDAFYTSIANAYLALGDAESASRYLEILRRRDVAQASALALLGDIYINEGLAKLALTTYMDALATGEMSETKGLRSLRAFLMRGYYDEAEVFMAAFEDAQGDDLSDTQAREILNLRAQLALAKGEDEEAAAILEEVLETDPLNGNALMLLGDYNRQRKDPETAIYYYERALSLPDFQREAQLQLARIYVQQREYQEAIRQLEGAQQLEYSSNVQDFLDAVRSAYNRSL